VRAAAGVRGRLADAFPSDFAGPAPAGPPRSGLAGREAAGEETAVDGGRWGIEGLGDLSEGLAGFIAADGIGEVPRHGRHACAVSVIQGRRRAARAISAKSISSWARRPQLGPVQFVLTWGLPKTIHLDVPHASGESVARRMLEYTMPAE
jgi:hypothetical protein